MRASFNCKTGTTHDDIEYASIQTYCLPYLNTCLNMIYYESPRGLSETDFLERIEQ